MNSLKYPTRRRFWSLYCLSSICIYWNYWHSRLFKPLIYLRPSETKSATVADLD